MNKKIQSLLKENKRAGRDYEIVRMREEEKMTFEDIGIKYGLTRERIRQIYIKNRDGESN